MTRHLVVVLAMLGLGLPAIAHAQSVRVQLKDAKANVVGTAMLSDVPGGVRVTLRVDGLKPGEHEFHIHAVGTCEPPDFMSAGPHFNPYGKHHGLANPAGPHAGDFPNLEVGADGTGSLDTTDSLVTLKEGPNSVFRPGRDFGPTCERRDFGSTVGTFRGNRTNPRWFYGPETSGNPCRPRSLFFRARSSQGASRVVPRGDLRAVMTNETVPAERPGTVVDELFIRVNGGDGVCGTNPLRAKSF